MKTVCRFVAVCCHAYRSRAGRDQWERVCAQVKGITDGGLKPRRIKKIAVLGGGLMGSGIATASALAGIDVLLKEINDKFLQVDTFPRFCDATLTVCTH